jgi:hypothetical protein
VCSSDLNGSFVRSVAKDGVKVELKDNRTDDDVCSNKISIKSQINYEQTKTMENEAEHVIVNPFLSLSFPLPCSFKPDYKVIKGLVSNTYRSALIFSDPSLSLSLSQLSCPLSLAIVSMWSTDPTQKSAVLEDEQEQKDLRTLSCT